MGRSVRAPASLTSDVTMLRILAEHQYARALLLQAIFGRGQRQ